MSADTDARWTHQIKITLVPLSNQRVMLAHLQYVSHTNATVNK